MQTDDIFIISDATIDEAVLIALDEGYVLSRERVMKILYYGLKHHSWVSNNLMANLMNEFPGIRMSAFERMLDIAVANIE